MSDELYHELRALLDKFPRGYVETKSGVEIKILKKLFTEADAKLTVQLSTVPEEIHDIAARLEWDIDDLRQRLDEIANKGLIFRIRRGDKAYYRAAAYAIGLYEYSVVRMDKELAELFRQYYEEAYVESKGEHKIPGFKVLPVEQGIDMESVLLPYQRVEQSIREARKIAVSDCPCRKEAILLGEGCDHPLENCLCFGAAAEYYIEAKLGREISADEAIKILKEADESGLVHAGANSVHLSNICNCCPCCCLGLKTLVQKGSIREKHFNPIFEPVIDEDSCTACEVCVERCPVDAIVVEDFAQVDRDKCLGCGLCTGTCPVEAITMVVRDDVTHPFSNVKDLANAVMEAKGKEPLTVKTK
ncbi:4Fe-4S binding protein [Thermodesulfobacteriota bacterium]